MIYVCLGGVAGLIITSLNKKGRGRARAIAGGAVGPPPLSRCVFTAPGVPAGAACQAACGGYSPPPVRAAAKSTSCKKPRTIKARPGGFWPPPGELLLLRIRHASGEGWRWCGGEEGCRNLVLTHSCVSGPSFVLCLCVSRLLPRTSIWFDFRLMFTPPVPVPFYCTGYGTKRRVSLNKAP